MITAKELRLDFIKVWLGDFLDSEQKDGIKALNKIIELYCKEQREICAGCLEKGTMQDEVDAIINAPMPEIC